MTTGRINQGTLRSVSSAMSGETPHHARPKTPCVSHIDGIRRRACPHIAAGIFCDPVGDTPYNIKLHTFEARFDSPLSREDDRLSDRLSSSRIILFPTDLISQFIIAGLSAASP